ncbi:MAG: hypothetical protein MSC31_00775 [Solirubrobacteraceae bacterium MAG38_C4-C5]|nr:hypothetical protein [Candidatus Siliceabacter maunaloa]
MGLRNLTDKAKQVFEERGGSERAKQDGDALKRIAKGEGSLSDKAKAGMERLRGEPASAAGGPGETDPASPAQTEPRPDPGAPSTSTKPPGAPPSRS